MLCCPPPGRTMPVLRHAAAHGCPRQTHGHRHRHVYTCMSRATSSSPHAAYTTLAPTTPVHLHMHTLRHHPGDTLVNPPPLSCRSSWASAERPTQTSSTTCTCLYSWLRLTPSWPPSVVARWAWCRRCWWWRCAAGPVVLAAALCECEPPPLY